MDKTCSLFSLYLPFCCVYPSRVFLGVGARTCWLPWLLRHRHRPRDKVRVRSPPCPPSSPFRNVCHWLEAKCLGLGRTDRDFPFQNRIVTALVIRLNENESLKWLYTVLSKSFFFVDKMSHFGHIHFACVPETTWLAAFSLSSMEAEPLLIFQKSWCLKIVLPFEWPNDFKWVRLNI